MKILITIMMSIAFVYSLSAQEPVQNSEAYCLILGTQKILGQKVTVQVDFGQGINKWRPKDSRLTDQNGEPIEFNSMIDALNYMADLGWEFVDAYAVTIGTTNVYHWLMKKEIE